MQGNRVLPSWGRPNEELAGALDGLHPARVAETLSALWIGLLRTWSVSGGTERTI
jgi:hypothetical protein